MSFILCLLTFDIWHLIFDIWHLKFDIWIWHLTWHGTSKQYLLNPNVFADGFCGYLSNLSLISQSVGRNLDLRDASTSKKKIAKYTRTIKLMPTLDNGLYSKVDNDKHLSILYWVRTLTRGGMYWKIHIQRFPEGGDFAPPGPRDCPRAISRALNTS